MHTAQAPVCLVDDDPGFREAMTEHLSALGFDVASFACAAEYLRTPREVPESCLILDLHLPDINGLELQKQLADKGAPQIIFVSGRGDIASSGRAIKAGAIEFLAKPVDEEA